jgi:hypothetical protein
MSRNARPLAKIEADLEAAFGRESRGPIEVGALLTEAKELLDAHGAWLPWLGNRFAHLILRTAQRYMLAFRFSVKYGPDGRNATCVSHLKLTPTALYKLAAIDDGDDREIIKRALREAETKWVSADRVDQIEEEIELERRPPPSP